MLKDDGYEVPCHQCDQHCVYGGERSNALEHLPVNDHLSLYRESHILLPSLAVRIRSKLVLKDDWFDGTFPNYMDCKGADFLSRLRHVMRKPVVVVFLCIKKDVGQLCVYRAADQLFCFCNVVQFMYLLNPKYKAFSYLLWFNISVNVRSCREPLR